MSITCQRCGTQNPEGLANCSSCGAALPRGGGIPLLAVLCCLMLLGFTAALIFPLFTRYRGSRKAVCQSNLKQLALATLLYAEDSNDRLPLAVTYPYHMAYIRRDTVLRCPEDKGAPPSYSLVPERLGAVLEEVKEPERTLLLYEGRQGLVELRHDGGAHAAFVDAHVKWIGPPTEQPAAEGAKVPLSTFEEWARSATEPEPGAPGGG